MLSQKCIHDLEKPGHFASQIFWDTRTGICKIHKIGTAPGKSERMRSLIKLFKSHIRTLVEVVSNFSAEPLDLPKESVTDTAEERVGNVVAMLNCETGKPSCECTANSTPSEAN
jgi:hypothetical protein